LNDTLITRPPFRAPHHTASNISIVGGGTIPRPGEITLAHRGVLYMDEFPEFDRKIIESLRQPLEDKMITVARAHSTITFPAQTILLASMNNCPCGKPKLSCICSLKARDNYWRKISGPIIDRIDIWMHIDSIDYKKMSNVLNETKSLSESPKNTGDGNKSNSMSRKEISARVAKAREAQKKRFESIGRSIHFNSEMNAGDIERCLILTDNARFAMESGARKLNISGRAFHRVLKVARTIADLDGTDILDKKHIDEAMQYRKSI
jgi:magnesium chelatase family protein